MTGFQTPVHCIVRASSGQHDVMLCSLTLLCSTTCEAFRTIQYALISLDRLYIMSILFPPVITPHSTL
jgi:hypothetical protein